MEFNASILQLSACPAGSAFETFEAPLRGIVVYLTSIHMTSAAIILWIGIPIESLFALLLPNTILRV